MAEMRQVEGHKEPGQKVTKTLGITVVEKGSRPHRQSVPVAMTIRTSRLRGAEQSGWVSVAEGKWELFP